MAEENKNSYVKWYHLIWIMGVIIGVLYFLGNSVVANEQKNQADHTEIRKCITDYVIPMREDIRAIKTKLEIN